MSDDEREEPGEDYLRQAGRRIDRVLGDWSVQGWAAQDPDERALDRLEAHLRATGELYPQGSVWQEPTQGVEPVRPSPAHQLRPPEYRGRRGAHRSRRWWRFW